MARCSLLALLAPLTHWEASMAATTTCGEVKKSYKDNGCCGQPEKKVDVMEFGCPFNFNKPDCRDAEGQSPRDLTQTGDELTTIAPGQLTPKAATLNAQQASFLPLVNVHFHLGAEHKSNAYMDATDADAFDKEGNNGRRLAAGKKVRPGFMCSNEGIDASKLDNSQYTWQYCKNVEVGKSYEVHYVHSSAGLLTASELEARVGANKDVADYMSDGLGGAANGRGLLNPMVAVQGQVYHIVMDSSLPDNANLTHGWETDHEDAVMYAGSTTGPSHDNSVCSPFAITWHVDRDCHRVSPGAFDNMCKVMKEKYGLEADLYPHGSRMIVDEKWVVKAEYVTKYVAE